MIKKLLQLYWYEKSDKTQEHKTIRKFFARIAKHGFGGMSERLEKEYKNFQKDLVAYSKISKKYTTFKIRILFLTLFILASVYFLAIKSELYESQTALMVRDLSATPTASPLGLAILGSGSNSQLQDSMVVTEYLRSLDMLQQLDKKYHLIAHYKSDAIDPIGRLAKDATTQQILEFYRSRLHIEYDEVSAILHIAYAHTDPKQAQAIVTYLVKEVEHAINEFNRRKAKKQLKFIEHEHEIKQKQLDEAAAKLEAYQNKYHLLDPTTEATSYSGIIANLESNLTQKQIEYKTKSAYLNRNNYELAALRAEIRAIKKSLKQAKKGLAGDGATPLNKILFTYAQLKMQLEFATEVYKSTLLQLETIRLDTLKSAKTLSIISQPDLPDGYAYPNKPKVFITLIIVMFLLYGIFSMLLAIIKDHKE